MFVNLVKIKKYLIYLFLFLSFNCFSLSTKAAETTRITEYDAERGTGEEKVIYIRGVTFNTNGDKMFVTGGAVGQYRLNNGNFDISDVTFLAPYLMMKLYLLLMIFDLVVMV